MSESICQCSHPRSEHVLSMGPRDTCGGTTERGTPCGCPRYTLRESNKHKGDVMERWEQRLPTLDQMRAASEALKGVERACDITHAKPEFVTFIRMCSPASVLSVLNQHAALVEQRDALAEAARSALDWLTESFDIDKQPSGVVAELRDALASLSDEPQSEGGSGES